MKLPWAGSGRVDPGFAVTCRDGNQYWSNPVAAVLQRDLWLTNVKQVIANLTVLQNLYIWLTKLTLIVYEKT